MSTLIIWIDMLRPNLIENSNIKSIEHQFMERIKSLGGKNYKRVFTPSPDTPRGMASFYTGKIPQQNGCNSRLTWPKYFLSELHQTIFDPILSNGNRVYAFSNPNERYVGLFPNSQDEKLIHNKDLNLDGYLDNINVKPGDLVFISIPDYHWTLTDYKYLKSGHVKGLERAINTLDLIEKKLDFKDFDDIIIFSEHGFKLRKELKMRNVNLLDRDRTNIFFFHKSLKDKDYTEVYNLLGLEDIGSRLIASFSDGNSLTFNDIVRKFVLIEDYHNILPYVNELPSLWAAVTNKGIYQRSMESGLFISHEDLIQNNGICEEYDQILMELESFKNFHQLNKVKNKYEKRIFQKEKYVDGSRRFEVNRAKLFFHFILEKLSG
jgi:hypothetical protein